MKKLECVTTCNRTQIRFVSADAGKTWDIVIHDDHAHRTCFLGVPLAEFKQLYWTLKLSEGECFSTPAEAALRVEKSYGTLTLAWRNCRVEISADWREKDICEQLEDFFDYARSEGYDLDP